MNATDKHKKEKEIISKKAEKKSDLEKLVGTDIVYPSVKTKV